MHHVSHELPVHRLHWPTNVKGGGLTRFQRVRLRARFAMPVTVGAGHPHETLSWQHVIRDSCLPSVVCQILPNSLRLFTTMKRDRAKPLYVRRTLAMNGTWSSYKNGIITCRCEFPFDAGPWSSISQWPPVSSPGISCERDREEGTC